MKIANLMEFDVVTEAVLYSMLNITEHLETDKLHASNR